MDAQQRMIEDVRNRAGLDAEEAGRVIEVVLSVLGERLDEHLSRVIGERLPSRFCACLTRGPHTGDFDLDELYERVAAREGVREGFAREHTQVVCRALAIELDAEAHAHIAKELPAAFAALFERPEPVGEVMHARHAIRAPSPRRQTLATGRPGHDHPLSDDQSGGAHRDSVVRSADPHADTKLSTTEGTSQEREHRTISEGHPGSERPLSESD